MTVEKMTYGTKTYTVSSLLPPSSSRTNICVSEVEKNVSLVNWKEEDETCY